MLNGLSMPEMLVVMVIAVLLFGKRLPEVGRSLGRGIVEFKKGLRGMEDGFEPSTADLPARTREPAAPEPSELSVPKFEPPTSAPIPRPGSEAGAYRD